jgi:hypothetical protein
VADNWPNTPSDVLRGMWGTFQSSAQTFGRSAVAMWNAVNDAAAAAAEYTLSITSPTVPTALQIQDAAHALIGNVTIQDVNQMAVTVGQWMAAKENLLAQGLDQQILGTSIFTPPWSTTAANPGVPDRYRIRVLRDITYRGIGATVTQWATYELGGPLTTLQDALDAADAAWALSSGLSGKRNSSAEITSHVDYEIEQV